MSRQVIVDDTDPGINYTSSWFLDHGSKNSLGNFGPPYLGTLHGTDSDASFLYSFNGTQVIMYGTKQFQDTTNPSWQCIVDGVSVPSINVTYPDNNLRICQADLSDGPHVLTVNVAVSDQMTFWLDYLLYLPSPSMSLAQVSLLISAGDSQFQYGTGWSPIFPGNMTGQTGSTFSFEFTGISLIWRGFYLNTLPNASTTATYAVDGQSPITFSVNGSSFPDGTTFQNTIFFQTAQLSSGPHKLDVVYQGNSATTPLTLQGLFVQNNALSSSSSLTTPTSSSTSSLSQSANLNSSLPSSSSSSSVFSNISIPTGSSSGTFSASGTLNASTNGSRNVRSIIGGAIGGFALLTFIILAVLFLRQRNNRSRNTVVPSPPPSSSALLIPFPFQPQRRQETLPSSVTVTGKPTSLQVREADVGIRSAQRPGGTDQDGYFGDSLPPDYLSAREEPAENVPLTR